jgi:S-DNA-T family DNA segregation ATPase FtsK/SpoIIIE
MLDRSGLIRRALAASLTLGWLFLALSLAGHDPLDPPGGDRWSAGSVAPSNPCGAVGAAIAFVGFRFTGWASLLALPAVATIGAHAFRRRPLSDTFLRGLGVLLLMLVCAAFLAALDDLLGRPCLPRAPAVGSGGYAGAMAVSFLGGQCGPIGMALVLTALAVVGSFLGADLLVTGPARELSALFARRGGSSGVGPDYAATVALGPWALPVAEELRVARPALERPSARPIAPGAGGTGATTKAARTASAPRVRATRPQDGSYAHPPGEMLEPPASFPVQEHEALIQQRAAVLERTLNDHGCVVRVVQIDTGPVITMFEVELEAGLRVSRVTGLASDLAIALGVESVRIVYPLPGKSTVGLEIPNERRAMVRLSEVMITTAAEAAKMRIPLFLGKDVKGGSLVYDLARMPHLLIAGRTGTGKSVCLNAVIISILMTRRPDEVKVILIDPKKVELSQFRRIPHLMHPVVTEMGKAEALLAWACEKMEERYALLERARVRSIHDYNELGADELYDRLGLDDPEEQARVPFFMPSIVIIADELADMVMQNKEVETHIIRLAQKARAAGIHLILATQRPTVDILTGLIKSNMPARIAFQVTSRNDSRVVLDEMGAEKLLGNGDMLFLVPNTSNLVRAQGTYVSDREINDVCSYLEQYPVVFDKELVKLKGGAGSGSGGGKGGSGKERDDLYEEAVEIIIREGKGSTSLLQRAMGIGYVRAARLIDYMAEDGIVGEAKGSVARDVFYSWEEWEALKRGDDADEDDDNAASEHAA